MPWVQRAVVQWEGSTGTPESRALTTKMETLRPKGVTETVTELELELPAKGSLCCQLSLTFSGVVGP